MRYLHTMIRVHDVEASLAFYCDLLGLVEIRRREDEKGRYTNFFLAAPDDTGTATAANAPLLELTYNWPSEDGTTEEYTGGRNFGHLCYEVRDIYAFCAKLKEAGVTINRPPRDGRMAFIKSPDGISLEILQQGDALTLQEPWQSMENTGTW